MVETHLEDLAVVSARMRVPVLAAWLVLSLLALLPIAGAMTWSARDYLVSGSESVRVDDALLRLYDDSWDGRLLALGGTEPAPWDQSPPIYDDIMSTEGRKIAKSVPGGHLGGFAMIEANYGIAKLQTDRPESEVKPAVPKIRAAAKDQPTMTWYVSGIAAGDRFREQRARRTLERALLTSLVLLLALGIPALGLRGTVANALTVLAATLTGSGAAVLFGLVPGIGAAGHFPGLVTAGGCAAVSAGVLAPMVLRRFTRADFLAGDRAAMAALALPLFATVAGMVTLERYLLAIGITALVGTGVGVLAAYTVGPAMLPRGVALRLLPPRVQAFGNRSWPTVVAGAVVLIAVAAGAFHARQPESRLRLWSDPLKDSFIRSHDIESRPFVRDQVTGDMAPIYVFIAGLGGAPGGPTRKLNCETHKCPPATNKPSQEGPVGRRHKAETKLRKYLVGKYFFADAADGSLSAAFEKGPNNEFDLMTFTPSDPTLEAEGGVDRTVRGIRRYLRTSGVLPAGIHASVGGYDAVRVDFRRKVGSTLPWLVALLSLVAGALVSTVNRAGWWRMLAVGLGAPLALGVGAAVWNIPSVGYRFMYPYHLEPFRWVDQWAAYPLLLITMVPVAALLVMGLSPTRSDSAEGWVGTLVTGSVVAAASIVTLFSASEPGLRQIGFIVPVAIAWGGIGVAALLPALLPPLGAAANRLLRRPAGTPGARR